MTKLAACAVALLSLSVPSRAHAAFFGLFSTAQASAATGPSSSALNSQTMPVLAASENPGAPLPPAAPITVVEGTALLVDAAIDGDVVAASHQGSEQISVYEVRPGDTLSQIATMYGVSMNTIRWSNDLKGPIAPGQRLVILPISGVSHTVARGDTVESIAKKYGADAGDIRGFNDIQGNELAVGQVVIVPDGEIETVATPAKRPASSGASSSGGKSPASRVAVGRMLAATAQTAGIKMVRPAVGVKTQGIHGHNGIDVGLPVGSTVYAAAAGTVIIAKGDGWNGGYGGYVVIDHGGVQTLYAHLSSVSVSVGNAVSAGDVIGASGSTGKSTGPHLHFEVRGATNPF